MIGSQRLSHPARAALANGLLAAGATVALYVLVVVATTPNLPLLASINAAFSTNSVVIGGTSAVVGAQLFFSSYGRSFGCSIGKKQLGAGSGGSAAGAFFSFFSLVPLGCCGSWLLVLSVLPSIVGGAISVFLIEYSRLLSHVALSGALGFAAYSGIMLYMRVKGK